MKLLFCSDIHGDLDAMKNIMRVYESEKADKLVLSGDLLYHGPRNDIVSGYNPKAVIEMLNNMADNIICVRGNCDTEVDQMVLNFPVLSDYTLIYDNDLRIYVTHGHIYNIDNPLKLKASDVMVNGHTHVSGIWEKDGCVFLNPGSASLPKENTPKSYMIYENRCFKIKDFDGNIVKEITI